MSFLHGVAPLLRLPVPSVLRILVTSVLVLLASSGRATGQSAGSGDSHAFVVDSGGTLWMVGSNSQGRLGDGSTTQRRERVALTGLGPVVAAAGGSGRTLALNTDGSAHAWNRPFVSGSGQTDTAHARYETADVVKFDELLYPSTYVNARIQGVVVLGVDIDVQGAVSSIETLSGSRALAMLAVENVKSWRFRSSPSLRRTVVVYEFEIAQGDCDTRGRSLFVLKHGYMASIKGCLTIRRFE